MNRRRLVFVGLLTLAAGVVFTAIASQVFLRWAGLVQYFEYPYYQWWYYAWNYFFDGAPKTRLQLGAGGVAGAFPILLAARLWYISSFGIGLSSTRSPRHVVRRNPSVTRLSAPAIVGPSDNYGHARWASEAEMRARWPAPKGAAGAVVVGELYDPRAVSGPYKPSDCSTWGPGGRAPLLYDDRTTGSGHSTVVGGSGSGKTEQLKHSLRNTWFGPAVVLDPKETLGEQLRDDREKMGHTVRILGPKCGFNVLGWIPSLDALDTAPAVDRVVEWVCGELPEHAGGSSNEKFFNGAAKDTTKCLIDHALADPTCPDKTLRTVRAMICAAEKEFQGYLKKIHEGSPSPRARQLAAFMCAEPNDTLRSIQYTAARITAWLSTPKWASLVCGDSFAAADITTGKTDVFIPIQFQDLSAEPAVARCILGALFNAAFEARGEGGHTMLFSLDEIAELKEFGPVRTTLREGREFRMSLHLMYQSLADIKRQWGSDGLIELGENCTWMSYAGIKDYAVAEEISKMVGSYPVVALSEAVNTGTTGRGFELRSRSRGSSVTYSEMGRRRLLPDECMNLREDAQIVFSRGCPPMICGQALDYRRQAMKRRAA